MKPAICLLAVAALLASGAIGCGSGDSGEPTTTTGPGTTSTTPPESAPSGAVARTCPISSGDIEALRVTGTSCETGRLVAGAWSRDKACAPPTSASRFSCTARGWRCLGITTDRGANVACAGPGHSIAFVTRR
jgi:hypothetical protein